MNKFQRAFDNLVLHIPGMKQRLLNIVRAETWTLLTKCVGCHEEIATTAIYCEHCGEQQQPNPMIVYPQKTVQHEPMVQHTGPILHHPRKARLTKVLTPKTDKVPAMAFLDRVDTMRELPAIPPGVMREAWRQEQRREGRHE